MNPVFATEKFWQPYLTLEPEDLSDDDIAAQLDGLREDYVVREDPVSFEVSGREYIEISRVVEFSFSCGDNHSLLIEYEIDAEECGKTLFLVDSRSGVKSQMGWWDLARWHPYCLRPAELDALLQYWSRWDPRWREQELPLLLLCQFVGLCDPESRDSLATRVEAAYRAPGFPGSDAGRPAVPLHVMEDYRWEIEGDLGWVFTSDDYACYSTRNRAHTGSDEGCFPFAAFREAMTQVQTRLGLA